MMKLPRLLLGSAILVCANFAVAQTATTTTTTTAEAPVGGVTAGTTVTTPVMPASPAMAPAADPSITTSTSVQSADPYVQKREADAAAKGDYKMKKNMAKEEYKEEKAEAKSQMKAEKRQAARDRKNALSNDPKPAMPETVN